MCIDIYAYDVYAQAWTYGDIDAWGWVRPGY